jgi:hypothetical protein
MATSNLDQLPSNIPIVDNRGFPTNAFVFYLLKLLNKLTQGLSQKIINTSLNYTVLVGNYSIVVDATSGNKVITMPLANTASSLIVGITKKDTSVNTVTIQSQGSDLICGSATHVLLFQNEVLNFISDGTSWQIAN